MTCLSVSEPQRFQGGGEAVGCEESLDVDDGRRRQQIKGVDLFQMFQLKAASCSDIGGQAAHFSVDDGSAAAGGQLFIVDVPVVEDIIEYINSELIKLMMKINYFDIFSIIFYDK